MPENDYTVEQLSESEGRFHAQYQHNPIPTFTWQKTGDTFTLRYYNLAAVALTKGDVANYINRTAREIYGNRPDITGYMERCFNEKQTIHTETVSENFKPPKTFVVTWSFAPPDLIIIYTEDITRRRRDEEERKRLQHNLLQAQKMESVGRLAGGIAHDFNNMLTVINGYIDLIKLRLPEDDPLLDDITEIEKAAKQSQDMTRQLLAFSRQEIISPETLDLNTLIENARKSLLAFIGEDIELKYTFGEGLWKIKMDQSQMHQVLMNFAINARDAMPDGGSLSIATWNESFDPEQCEGYPEFKPGDFVGLSITDSGTGIDSETLNHIFEPFFTTKERGKGTGLGLATVYGIVRQNQGFIRVDSEPGRGTAFRIYIPRDLSETVANDESGVKRLTRDAGSILLVEDNSMVREMITDMLEVIGYSVTPAGSPTEAVALFSNSGFSADIVLTDVVMPQMNGREMERRIQELRPGTRVLYMSGYTSDVIVHRGVHDGEINFIQKPFSIEELADKLKQIQITG